MRIASVRPDHHGHAHCDLPVRRLRPRPGQDRGAVGQGLHARSTTATTTRSSRPAPSPIKEERSDLVKHHLWVLWTDYFKPPHFEKYPQLNDAVQRGHQAGRCRRHQGLARRGRGRQTLLAKIDEIAEIFWETKKA